MALPEYPHALVNKATTDGGAFIAGVPARGVLHTTESDGFTPQSSSYFGHRSYPHFTIVQRGVDVVIYQHISITRAARALRNQSGGVQTNRARAIQIEIVGRAAHSASFSQPLLAAIARWMRWVEQQTGVKPEAPLAFHGSEAFGVNGVARMTNQQWQVFNAWCGHQHVPENDHWDPGKIPIDRLIAFGDDAITVPPLPPAATAAAVSGKRYMVIGVAADDALNCRLRPGASNPILGTFAAGQKGIEATDQKPRRVGSSWWREVKIGDQVGWVSDRYIVEHWTENAATFAVDVRTRLNMRAGPGTENAVVGKLTAGETVTATGVVAMIGGHRWREIRAGGGLGWVDAHYLRGPTGPADDQPDPEQPPGQEPKRPGELPAFAAVRDWANVPIGERRRHAMALLTTKYGYTRPVAAGIVGNLMKESGVMPNRLEGSTSSQPLKSAGFDGRKRTWTPAEVRDRDGDAGRGPRRPGVGLAQWTSEHRRKGLFAHAYEGKVLGTDILFNMDAQVDYLVKELRSAPYDERVNVVLVRPGCTLEEASDEFVYRFEVPAAVLTADHKKLLPRDAPSVVKEFEERRRFAREAFNEFEADVPPTPAAAPEPEAPPAEPPVVEEPVVETIRGTVVIDPGHGGSGGKVGGSSSNNARSPSGTLEKTMTLDFANLVQGELQRISAESGDLDVTVHLTRDADRNLGLATRANVARDRGADVFLSIHFNGFNGKARGVETLVLPAANGNVNLADDRALAARVQRRVVAALRKHDPATPDRGVKEQGLSVLKDVSLGNAAARHPCRAALLEVEFIDNPAVDALLNTGASAAQVRRDVCAAIAEGIVEDLRAHG